MADPIVARRGLVATYVHRPRHAQRCRVRHQRPVPIRVRPRREVALDLFQSWLVRAAVLVAVVVALGLAGQLDLVYAAAAVGGLHPLRHPLAGQTVKLRPAAPNPDLDAGALFTVEDWWDRVTGRSWMWSDGNPAAVKYAFRSGLSPIPLDDEVVYGKDERGLGHLVHTSELIEPSTEEKA